MGTAVLRRAAAAGRRVELVGWAAAHRRIIFVDLRGDGWVQVLFPREPLGAPRQRSPPRT
jgi:hypothetical protein